MEKVKVNNYSPTGVLEDYLRSLESDTISSKESTSGSEDQKDSSKPSSKWVDFVHLFRSKSKRCLPTFHPISSGLQLSRRLSSSFREQIGGIIVGQQSSSSSMIGEDVNYFKPHWKNFSFSQLQSATNNFSNG